MTSDHRHSTAPDDTGKAGATVEPAQLHRSETGQLARMLRALVLLLAAAGLGLAWLAWRAGHGGWAALALLSVPGMHSLALAAEMLWMRRVNARGPLGAARPRTLVRAWLGECADALCVFGLWQPFLSRRPADVIPPPEAPQARGVVLVHGFVCNRGIWRRWLARLADRRIPAIAVNLEPVFGRIDDYAPTIEAAVRRMEATTGLPPVVVAHSMGGLATRHWWRFSGRVDRLHHLITIGSPHHGTCMASLAVAPNARQMRRGHPWLAELDRSEPAALRARTTCFYSDCDNIVFPAHSAALEGAHNRALRGTGHISLVWRDEPWDALLARLADPAPAGDRRDRPAEVAASA
jgi:triacylglycerol lipase